MKTERQMPLIDFKGIKGKFISLESITERFYADNTDYYDKIEYELTIMTEDGYNIKVRPVKQKDADRIITCMKCSKGMRVKCWRDISILN